MAKRKPKSALRGSECQNCGVLRRVGLNGLLPPHKCAQPRQVVPSSPARRIIVVDDDGHSGAIRAICYGTI